MVSWAVPALKLRPGCRSDVPMTPDIQSRSKHAVSRRDWKRVHHSPLFWIGAVLFLAGLMINVLSDDLSWRPSDAATIGAAEYSSKILGNWQGTVEGKNETISFDADGSFVSSVRPGGFISTTLGQGITGTIRGTWVIKGKSITLIISGAEDERVLNNVATATIETFKKNELIVKSSTGSTSTFMR
jgi:hypothetical protein